MRLYNSISCLFVPLEVAPTSIGRVSFLCLSRTGSLPYIGGMNFYGHINKTRLQECLLWGHSSEPSVSGLLFS